MTTIINRQTNKCTLKWFEDCGQGEYETETTFKMPEGNDRFEWLNTLLYSIRTGRKEGKYAEKLILIK